MTRPTSRLEWFADPLNPLVVRAKWIGAGWHYRLHWGHLNEDGTAAAQRVLFTQPPVRHAFPTSGTYTLTATSEINDHVQVRVQVTVRPEKTPQVTLDDLGHGRARLNIKGGWPGDILHRVIWGDGSRPEEYTGTQLQPEHVYPPGTTEPQIVVMDVPARRVTTLVGPTVPPDPPPPGDGPTLTWSPNPVQKLPDGGSAGTGTLHLSGFPPNTLVILGRTWVTEEAEVVTDAKGRAQRDYTLWTLSFDPDDPRSAYGLYEHWQSIAVRWADLGDQPRQMWQPVNICEWFGNGCWWKPTGPNEQPREIPPLSRVPVTLDWDIHRPAVITIAVAPARNGIWRVDWGTGDGAQDVEVTNGRLRETHDYGRFGSFWVTVTDPAGRVGRRRIRPIRPLPETWKDGSLAIFQAYERHSNEPGVVVDCDCYSVLRVDAGDGRPLRQLHRPSLFCPDKAGNGISYAAAGDYTVTFYGPMTNPITYVHKQRARDVRGRSEFPIKQDEDPIGLPLDAVWRLDTTTPGGYSGEITVTNTTGLRVASWRLLFQLPSPALVAQVWPDTAILRGLGDGSYAITSTTNLDPGASTSVGLRVEPAGTPPIEPTNLRAFPFVPTKLKEIEHMGTQPKPPVLSPGGYVYAGKTVKLYAGNLPPWSTEIKMSSSAFASDEAYKTTIIGEGPQRHAVAEVMIGDVDFGAYPVVLHVGGGYTNQVWLTVEPSVREPITTQLTAEDNHGKMTLRVDGLTVNAGWAKAKTPVAVGGDKWFALTGYNRGQNHATGTIIRDKAVEPGKTYPIEVQLEFMGGHTEVVSGTVVAPADPKTPPIKGGLPTVFHHRIDTNKLGGNAETFEHRVEFGDDNAQPNARYGVAHELVVASHNGGKPDLPADIRAALRDLKPFTVARAEDHVTLIGGNPKLLAKNTNFKIKLLVTITPVTTSGSGYSDGEDAADWT